VLCRCAARYGRFPHVQLHHASRSPKLLEQMAEEGGRVYPVICKPCPWAAVEWLSRMQLRPKDAVPLNVMPKPKREQAVVDIVMEILNVVGSRNSTSDSDSTIIPRVFVDHLPVTGSRLFGRDDELAELDRAWTRGRPM